MTSKTWDYSKDFITFYNGRKSLQYLMKLIKKRNILLSYWSCKGEIGSIRKDLRTMPPVKEFGKLR